MGLPLRIREANIAIGNFIAFPSAACKMIVIFLFKQVNILLSLIKQVNILLSLIQSVNLRTKLFALEKDIICSRHVCQHCFVCSKD